MPYTVERGVRSFNDHDTPPEFASGTDEDAAAFNQARDEAFQTAEAIFEHLNDLYSPTRPTKRAEMAKVAEDLEALLARIKAIST